MKQGDSQLWWILGTALIVMVVVVIILLYFRESGGAGYNDIKGRISGLKDTDGDVVSDVFDKCNDEVVDSQKGVIVESNGCTEEQNKARVTPTP